MNNVLIGVLLFGLLLGGLGGSNLAKLNPFGGLSRPKAVQKSEGQREEYFRDRIKGIEYRFSENIKEQNRENSESPSTIGGSIGAFIDSSIQFIIIFVIGGLLLLFFTGFNVFKYVKVMKQRLMETRKALKQTIKAVEKAKPKMNGDSQVLKTELKNAHDEASDLLIRKLKNE
jgi:hypothetical protein